MKLGFALQKVVLYCFWTACYIPCQHVSAKMKVSSLDIYTPSYITVDIWLWPILSTNSLLGLWELKNSSLGLLFVLHILKSNGMWRGVFNKCRYPTLSYNPLKLLQFISWILVFMGDCTLLCWALIFIDEPTVCNYYHYYCNMMV